MGAAMLVKAGASVKPWRLSASVIVLAKSHAVKSCDQSAADNTCDYRICWVKRNRHSRFMPDVMVFPGGAVDASDRLICPTDHIRCAAVREVFEESGIGIFSPQAAMTETERQRWRDVVH